MSGFLLPLAVDAFASVVLIKRPRMLDIFIPDCAVQEVHHDRLTITEHPVEFGAAISDHAFKEPAEVNLQYAWSNSAQGNATALVSIPGYSYFVGGGSETYDQEVYAALLSLQASAQVFTLVTGKRLYYNMLMAEISVTVDETSEYSLMTNIVCREVIIVSTSSVTLADASNMANPASTAPTLNTGPQKLQPVTNPPAKVTLI